MRVLVTGHKGYIGVVLCPMLVARGHEVVGFDSDLYRACDYGEAPQAVPEIRKDIRDLAEGDLEGIDAVIHLAGLSNDPLGDLNPTLTADINTTASIRLAECAKAAKIDRFVFSSSCSNYGASGDAWLDETSAFNPVTPYGSSKVNVEKLLSRLADDSFSPTYLRSATAFGYSCRIRFDLVLNNLVAWAVTTGRVLIKSDGTPWRPIVHIEDISRAFVAVLEADRNRVHNAAFNVGRNEDNYTVREIAEIVEAAVPGTRIEFAQGGGPDKRCYRVDCRKITDVLPGFQPQWNAHKGALELRDRLATHGLSTREFEGIRYQRIAHVRHLMEAGLVGPDLRWNPSQ